MFKEYIDNLKKNQTESLIFIVAKDNIGKFLSEDDAKLLLELGIKTDLSAKALNGAMWRGYIAIIDRGVLKFEKLAKDRAELMHQYGKFKIKSTVWNKTACAPAEIERDGFNYCSNFGGISGRGLNFVVFDKQGNFISSASCDFYSSGCPFYDQTKKISEHKAVRNQALAESFTEKIKLPKLDLALPNYPWGETAVVFGHKKTKFTNFAVKNKLNITEINDSIIISTGKVQKSARTDFVFNGVVFNDSDNKTTLLIGENEVIQSCQDIQSLRHKCGEFELLIAGKDNFEFTKDYFGLSKWFYYHQNGIFAASTSFHLLVLLLKEACVQLEIDKTTAFNHMVAYNWITAHLYTYETFIKGIFYVPVGKDLRYSFSKNKIELIKTPFANAQIDIKKWDVKLYKHYLEKAKKELIDNMTAIFSHPQINRVIIDITDGLDTRTNLVTFSQLSKELKSKARAYSTKRENTPINTGINFEEDFKTACGLSNLLNIPFIDIDPQVSVLDKPKTFSSFLGQIFMGRIDVKFSETVYPDTIQLGGGNGESNLGSGCYGVFSYDASQDLDKYYRIFFIKDKKAANEFKRSLHEVLKTFPSDLLQNQLDLHYTNFRNTFHFASKYSPQFSINSIQTPHGYRAKKLMQAREGLPFYTIQHDLMTFMSPEIAAFPYVSEKQNKRLKMGNPYRLFTTEVTPVKLDYSEDGYENTFLKRQTQFVPNRSTYSKELAALKNATVAMDIYIGKEIYLYLLAQVSEFFPEIKNHPEFFKVATENNAQKTIFCNKLLHLYYLNEIINKKT